MVTTPMCIRPRPFSPPPAPVKDPAYLSFIRSQPCAVRNCRAGYVEAAHTGPRGLGQKADDRQAIPLCRRHHEAYHRGRKAFDRVYRLDIPALIRELQDWYTVEKLSA